MMWQTLVSIFFVLGSIVNAELPEYIRPCSRSAPDFKKCCVDRGNSALPFLVEGDKKFKIPSMNPLRYPRVDVNAGPNLKINLQKIDLYGLPQVKLNDMDIDFNKRQVYFDLYAPKLTLIGEYEVDGQLLVLPIQGKGPCNITAEDDNFKYSFRYEIETRNGIDFAVVQEDDNLEFTIGKAYFHFDNLFNGNKQMGDNVNNFLNENQQDVIRELGGAVSMTITTIARSVGGNILRNIPLNELFLP